RIVTTGTTVFLLEVLLAAIGFRRSSAATRRVAMALIVPGLLLSFGATIDPGGVALPNLPYRLLLEQVAVLRRLWWPHRALAMVHVGLAVLGGGALDRGN